MKTIEQQRAADALARVKDLSGNGDGFKKLYRAYVDRLGPTIIMNGLGQALATECASAGANEKKNDREKAHDELYKSVSAWLCRSTDGVYAGQTDLLQAITEQDEKHYLHAQAEALSWLVWHKKLCRASFPKGDGGDE